MRLVSLFISAVFHPLLMPLYGIIILFTQIKAYFVYLIPEQARWIIGGIILLNTFILPASFLLFMLKTGRISDQEISKTKERRLPLIITFVFYITTYIVLRNISLHQEILALVLAAVIGLSAALLINYFWKISMHMIGICTLWGAFYYLAAEYQLNITGLLVSGIIISGVVGSARIHRGQHNFLQIAAGAALGFTIGYTTMLSGS